MAEGDGLPVVLAGDGIFVFLAQEANVVGVDEGFDIGRIGVELAVVELNGAAVLHAAMKGFEVVVALDGAGDFGSGDGERDHEQRDEEDGDEHNVALLGGGNGLAPQGDFLRGWVLLRQFPRLRRGFREKRSLIGAANWRGPSHEAIHCGEISTTCVLL